jgi:hypothetical protein
MVKGLVEDIVTGTCDLVYKINFNYLKMLKRKKNKAIKRILKYKQKLEKLNKLTSMKNNNVTKSNFISEIKKIAESERKLKRIDLDSSSNNELHNIQSKTNGKVNIDSLGKEINSI